MKCPKCQFENRGQASFCGNCGASLAKEILCPHCGATNPSANRFCDECGGGLKPRPKAPSVNRATPKSYTPKHLAEKILGSRDAVSGERKLVTVMFADAAGYTSMAEKLDPEDAHQIMDGCFELLIDEIHGCEGTINQFTGDGVMALFGAPIAHEDHAVRACHAALAVQKVVSAYGEDVKRRFGADFKMRIGLNSGEVVVGAIGDDLRMDYTAVGDTTNLAARMEALAEPGAICVAENTRRLAQEFFEFDFLGKMDVKGKRKPQAIYRLAGTTAIETRIEAAISRGLTKFVGRKDEMAALEEAFSRAVSGKGRVVGVVGEAGVGKSRLLHEFRKSASRKDCLFLEGRCLHYGGSMPYLPVLDIFKTLFDISDDDGEMIVNAKLSETIGALGEKASLYLPCLQDLLSLKVDDAKYLQVEPGQKKMRIFEAVRDLLVLESEKRPLALAVEDLHWIDKSSEEFFGYLIEWLASERILMVLLYRPEYTHQWAGKSYYRQIAVEQLTAEAAAELVRAVLSEGEPSPEIGKLVLGRAGGNPFFVEELTQSLLESGSIRHKGDRYVLSCDPSGIRIPGTVQAIIASRIDRIEEDMKQVVQMASVIGREFAFRILQKIMGMKEELKRTLLSLQGLEFISEKRLFPELEYIFKHALTQEVAYNSLLKKRRKKIHEKIGEAIEMLYPDRLEEYYELLAYHYGKGENKDKAFKYLDLANQKAAKLNSLEDAMSHFEEAMKVLDTLPDSLENRKARIFLLTNNPFVFQLQNQFPRYFELLKKYEPVAVALEDESLLGRFYARKGHCEFYLGRFQDSISTLNKAGELSEKANNPYDAGYAHCANAWNHAYIDECDQVVRHRNDVIRMCEKEFFLRIYVWAFCAASLAFNQAGRWNETIENGEKAVEISREYSDNSLYAFALMVLSIGLLRMGRYDKALKLAKEAYEKAPTPYDKNLAQGTLAWALCCTGEAEKGLEILANVVPIYRSIQLQVGVVEWGTALGQAYLLCGKYEEALLAADEILRISEKCGMKFHAGSAHLLFADINLKLENNAAESHFRKSIAIFENIKAENGLALAYAGYGKFHKQKGNIEKAREYLILALDIFERIGTMIEPDQVRKELDELSNDLG